jgi:hypothetical protein
MKRIFIVGILVLFSCAGIFAQNWTVDGRISFTNGGWDNSTTTTTSFVDLAVGHYITEDLNIGLSVYFSKPANGFTLAVGPRVKYDFLKFEKIYFSMFGSISYGKFFGSYSMNSSYYDGDRVHISLDPTVFFTISNNIEVYWSFADVYYYYFWLDDGRSYQYFRLQGPFSDPTFGLMFRF